MELIGLLVLLLVGAVLLIGIPAGLCLIGFKNGGSRLLGVFTGLMLVIYGAWLGFECCEFFWSGASVITDAPPKFGYGAKPQILDYVKGGWPGWALAVGGMIGIIRSSIPTPRPAKSSKMP